jgi:uncharacterized protein (TIGR02145 family)
VLSPLPVIFQQPDSKAVCHNTTARLYVWAAPATNYQWYKDGSPTAEGSGYNTANYTTGGVTGTATYRVVATNADCPTTAISDPVVVSTTTVGCPTGRECTPPEGAASFSTFIPCATAAVGTIWNLTDDRDGKVYRTVKMPDNRVWMAQNLNYQGNATDGMLTFQQYSKDPSTVTGSNTALIGSFWCSGKGNASTLAGCDFWSGALYTWETAMSFNGKGAWTELATVSYVASGVVASAATYNFGRKSDGTLQGRGICPPNWHVPTDAEWGKMLDAMDGGGSTFYSSAYTSWPSTSTGTVAGIHGKAKATCAANVSSPCFTEANPSWNYHATNSGTDTFSFCVVPSGFRQGNGSGFDMPGQRSRFWTSSAYSGQHAWYRNFGYEQKGVDRYANDYPRSVGYAVRCIKD